MASTLELDRKGDLTLILPGAKVPGAEDAEDVRVLVSSTVMRLASPVFEAMLKPNFSEGHTLALNKHVELPLPEDDTEAMVIICKVCHLDSKAGIDMQPSDLVRVAVMADKYGCVPALYFAAKSWFSQHILDMDVTSQMNLAAAAYILDTRQDFARSCGLLIMAPLSTFLYAESISKDDDLLRLFAHIQEKRRQSLWEISDLIESRLDLAAPLGISPQHWYCGCIDTNTTRLLVCLRDAKLWPTKNLRERDLNEILQTMRNLKFEVPACQAALRIEGELRRDCLECCKHGDNPYQAGCKHGD